jgi:predicted RNA polymerase sigma factor
VTGDNVEGLLRRLTPQVLGAVVRRYGHFDTAEDATQEALLAAAVQWPKDGIPDNPRGWLITVASRRLTDLLRSEQARQRREDTLARWILPRRPARTGPDGGLIPMAEQDRRRWNTGYIAEGVALITDALPRGATGPYQLQAAIAAVHDEAPTAEATDWPQIMALYELLLRTSDSPVVALNHAVAVAMVRGPRPGLDLLGKLEADERLAADHRLHAARGHLLEMAGDRAAARDSYQAAAQRTTSFPQQRYLHARAARLTDDRRRGHDAAD